MNENGRFARLIRCNMDRWVDLGRFGRRPADGALAVPHQPRVDTLQMEKVKTRQGPNLRPQLVVIHTDGARHLQLGAGCL